MISYFDFGPVESIRLNLTGEVADVYYSYDCLPENIQDGLQLLCHAIIQVLPFATRDDLGTLWIDDTFLICNICNFKYTVCNYKTGMAVINLSKDSETEYTTDFFSLKQMALSDPIISYAEEDAVINGRRF